MTEAQQQEVWAKAHVAASALAAVARATEQDGRDDLAEVADRMSNEIIQFAAKLNPKRIKLQEVANGKGK